jgi:hypothetical protein
MECAHARVVRVERNFKDSDIRAATRIEAANRADAEFAAATDFDCSRAAPAGSPLV